MGKVKLIQVFGIHWSEVFYGFGGLYGIVVVVWHFCSIFDSFGPSKCRQAIWLIAGVIKSASVWSLQIISDPVGPERGGFDTSCTDKPVVLTWVPPNPGTGTQFVWCSNVDRTHLEPGPAYVIGIELQQFSISKVRRGHEIRNLLTWTHDRPITQRIP